MASLKANELAQFSFKETEITKRWKQGHKNSRAAITIIYEKAQFNSYRDLAILAWRFVASHSHHSAPPPT